MIPAAVDLEELLAYDRWANGETAASVAAAGDASPRALAVLGHIAGAEWLWWTRVERVPPRLAVWPTLSSDACVSELRSVGEAWESYVSRIGVTGLSTLVAYTNSRGEAWTSTVQEILLHVVFHSAYHRGQIATAVRLSGHEPAYTDYIHAVRRGLLTEGRKSDGGGGGGGGGSA